jgi:hypothetical protein
MTLPATAGHEDSRNTASHLAPSFRSTTDQVIPESRTQGGLPDYEGETDAIDCGDVEAIENFNAAIVTVLSTDLRLAAAVISSLSKFPAHLRPFIYGFAGRGDTQVDSPTSSTPVHTGKSTGLPWSLQTPSSSVKRRKRAQDEDDDPEEEKKKNSRTKDYKKARLQQLKYACPFYIKYPNRYCVRNEVGGTGELYRPCMGNGWSQLRHLKYVLITFSPKSG